MNLELASGVHYFQFELSTFNFACLHVVAMERSKSLQSCKNDVKKEGKISWESDGKTGQNEKKLNLEDKKRRCHSVADLRYRLASCPHLFYLILLLHSF